MSARKVYTLSPLVGGKACNAACPFCVAHMTLANGVAMKAERPDLEQFRRACEYAIAHDANSLLYTSKGEPMLSPDILTEYLSVSRKFGFRSVELQTNGIPIFDRKPVTEQHLVTWRQMGLKLVAISISHYEPEANRRIYIGKKKREYIDLPALIKDLHVYGFAVRLACVMIRSAEDKDNPGQIIRGIDTPEELDKLIAFARENNVEELTIRPVNKPVDHAHADPDFDQDVARFVRAHYLEDEQKDALVCHLDAHGMLVGALPWGGRIYDVDGQNVCYTNSLTKDEGLPVGRQLIYFPDGRISDDWQTPAVPLDQYVREHDDSH